MVCPLIYHVVGGTQEMAIVLCFVTFCRACVRSEFYLLTRLCLLHAVLAQLARDNPEALGKADSPRCRKPAVPG